MGANAEYHQRFQLLKILVHKQDQDLVSCLEFEICKMKLNTFILSFKKNGPTECYKDPFWELSTVLA